MNKNIFVFSISLKDLNELEKACKIIEEKSQIILEEINRTIDELKLINSDMENNIDNITINYKKDETE